MRNRAAIRERYLRDGLPVRLGGLAANLARVKSFSDRPEHRDVVENLVEESKFFIEWTAPEAALEIQVGLVELQLQLAQWQLRWNEIWTDPARRASMAERAYERSKWVLEVSGLLNH